MMPGRCSLVLALIVSGALFSCKKAEGGSAGDGAELKKAIDTAMAGDRWACGSLHGSSLSKHKNAVFALRKLYPDFKEDDARFCALDLATEVVVNRPKEMEVKSEAAEFACEVLSNVKDDKGPARGALQLANNVVSSGAREGNGGVPWAELEKCKDNVKTNVIDNPDAFAPTTMTRAKSFLASLECTCSAP